MNVIFLNCHLLVTIALWPNHKSASISTVKHFSVDVQGAIGLGDYDFDKQGYVVTNSLADENGIESLTPYKRTSIAYDDSIKYKLSFIGTTKFNFVPMLDESAARIVNACLLAPGWRPPCLPLVDA